MRGIIRLVIIILAIIKSSFFWRRIKAEPRRILIVHDLLLGDTLLLAPLMKRLHEKHPHSQKYILAKTLFMPLFKTKPYGFIALKYNPKSFFDLFKIFLKGPYDQTFVAGDNRFSWLARALGSMWIIGIADDRPKWKNWMLDEVKTFDSEPSAWADMMGRLVDGRNPEPYQKNEWSRPKSKKLLLPFDRSKPYIVCHLGASNSLKFWQATSWQVLINNLRKQKYEVVLSVGPNEEYLINEVDPDYQYHHVPGTYSLIEMWALVEKAKLIVSVDTGIAHFAKLTDTPIVTLFGPGSPVSHGEGFFWKKSIHHHATKENFICRDQPILFRRKVHWLNRCGRGISECKTPGACMSEISPHQVLASLKNIRLT
jgi:ADP-heptose:LPS heptosyltransferase